MRHWWSRITTTGWPTSATGAPRRGGIDLGDFELLILDEAHAAARELADFCTVTFQREEIEGALGADWPDSADWDTARWRAWASPLGARAHAIYDTLNEEAQDKRRDEGRIPTSMVRELRHLRGLIRRLEGVASLS